MRPFLHQPSGPDSNGGSSPDPLDVIDAKSPHPTSRPPSPAARITPAKRGLRVPADPYGGRTSLVQDEDQTLQASAGVKRKSRRIDSDSEGDEVGVGDQGRAVSYEYKAAAEDLGLAPRLGVRPATQIRELSDESHLDEIEAASHPTLQHIPFVDSSALGWPDSSPAPSPDEADVMHVSVQSSLPRTVLDAGLAADVHPLSTPPIMAPGRASDDIAPCPFADLAPPGHFVALEAELNPLTMYSRGMEGAMYSENVLPTPPPAGELAEQDSKEVVAPVTPEVPALDHLPLSVPKLETEEFTGEGESTQPLIVKSFQGLQGGEEEVQEEEGGSGVEEGERGVEEEEEVGTLEVGERVVDVATPMLARVPAPELSLSTSIRSEASDNFSAGDIKSAHYTLKTERPNEGAEAILDIIAAEPMRVDSPPLVSGVPSLPKTSSLATRSDPANGRTADGEHPSSSVTMQTLEAVGEEELDDFVAEAMDVDKPVDNSASPVDKPKAPGVPRQEVPSLLSALMPQRAAAKPKIQPKPQATISKAQTIKQAKPKVGGTSKDATAKTSKPKQKSKVDNLKSQSAKERSSSVTASSVASASAASSDLPTPSSLREDTVETDDDEIYCICRKSANDEEADGMMVACDSCDQWFHAACIGIPEQLLKDELLDVYICQACEPATSRRTVYKLVCKVEGCYKSINSRQSKFCSNACAFKHSHDIIRVISNKRTLKQLSNTFLGYPPAISAVNVVHHTQDVEIACDSQVPRLLEDLRGQVEATRTAIERVRRRQQILRQAIQRWERLTVGLITEATGDLVAAKSRSKGSRQGGDERPCGWEMRMIWDDRELALWNGEDDLAEDGVCLMLRRRCDRHQGWQKTITASLDVELGQLERHLASLRIQGGQVEMSMQRSKAAEQARGEFREHLARKGTAL